MIMIAQRTSSQQNYEYFPFRLIQLQTSESSLQMYIQTNAHGIMQWNGDGERLNMQRDAEGGW
jgi:hypothetical protein